MNDPVFIVGNRRSGTTMLRLMLASHPRIGIPPEGGFVVTMGWIWERKQLSAADYPEMIATFFQQDNAQDWQMSPEQLDAAIRQRRPATFPEFVDQVYLEYLRLVFPGKRRWGDKTTWYLDFVPMIAGMFPAARFVHIVRDGRDIACSYRKMSHMPHEIERIAVEWATNMETLMRARNVLGPRRFLEVRYENLTADPEAELRKICRFLGEDYSPQMLEFHRKNREEKLEPERHMGWKAKTTKAVDTASVGRWRRELSGRDIQLFHAIAGSTIERLGYGGMRSEPSSAGVSVGDAIVGAYGTYWRGRQSLRAVKARMKRRLSRNGH